jgi:positive regulator of sigma E activity
MARPRSAFWIVSTHALTAAMAMPTVAALVSTSLVSRMGLRDPNMVLSVQVLGALAGSIAGVFYSLLYLRKAAAYDRWRALTLPSTLTFAAMTITGLVFWLVARKTTPREQAAWSACGVFAIAAFAWITARAFARFADAKP